MSKRKKPNPSQVFLNKIGLCEAKIEGKKEELSRLREAQEKITSALNGDVVSGSRIQDKLGDRGARALDLENEIAALKCEQQRITGVIDSVTIKNQYEVLHKHYVLQMPLSEIAECMNYSYRNVCIIHGRGLQAVEKILKGEENNG